MTHPIIKTLTIKSNSGDPEAQYQLGVLRLINSDNLKDNVSALELLTLSAEQGNTQAQSLLGNTLFEIGYEVLQEARLTFHRENMPEHAQRVLPHAELMVTKEYDRPQPVKVDELSKTDHAINLLMLAAKKGSLKAHLLLGQAYVRGGHGITKNVDTAEQWLAQGSSKGHLGCTMALSELYIQLPVSDDRHLLGRKTLEKAAADGEWAAQEKLSQLNMDGDFTQANLEQAIHWKTLADLNPNKS